MTTYLFLGLLLLVSLVYVALCIAVLTLISLGIVRLVSQQRVNAKQKRAVVITYVTFYTVLGVAGIVVVLLGYGEIESPIWPLWVGYVALLIPGTIVGYCSRDQPHN